MTAHTDAAGGVEPTSARPDVGDASEPGRTSDTVPDDGDTALDGGDTALDGGDAVRVDDGAAGLIRPPNTVTAVSGFGAVWALAALTYLVGLRGTVLGGLVIVAWLWESEWVAFAVGHVGLPAVVPGDVPLIEFAPIEVGLVALLLGSLAGAVSPHRALAVSLAALAVVWGLAFGTIELTGSLLAGSVVLVAVGGAATSLGHRYGRLRLGLLGGEPS